jgi:hypothetical protein
MAATISKYSSSVNPSQLSSSTGALFASGCAGQDDHLKLLGWYCESSFCEPLTQTLDCGIEVFVQGRAGDVQTLRCIGYCDWGGPSQAKHHCYCEAILDWQLAQQP